MEVLEGLTMDKNNVFSYIKENKNFICKVFIMYLLLLGSIYMLEKKDCTFFSILVRPVEIMSAFLSIIIIKEVSDIKKDYIAIAESEKHNQSKKFKEEVRFFTLYKKKYDELQKIIKNCEDFSDMADMKVELETIKPLLLMFSNDISVYVYVKKDQEKHKERYQFYIHSLDFLKISQSNDSRLDNQKREKFFKNNIDLIEDVVTCAETKYQNRQDIVSSYESSIADEADKIKQKGKKSANETDDTELD